MRFTTLDDWLSWQESLHPSEIDLGLERVARVLGNLQLTDPDFLVITVAGTNGKGSSVAMLQSILLAQGLRVGTYTSPHLLKYNERIQVNGQPVDDETLCESFERVDQARGDISLTYFEFGTLAAIDIFQQAAVEIAILEVGLGGRLDAVNVLDADVALITAIDVDHQDWLGNDRETIAVEKAGILRKGRPAVCSDPDVPESLIKYAHQAGARLYRLGQDFQAEIVGDHWRWQGVAGQVLHLPMPALPGEFQVNNAAGVLAVLEQLVKAVPAIKPVEEAVLKKGLESARLPGRFQFLPGRPVQILDVAHNAQSARMLADNLATMTCQGKTVAVLGMLADKDIAGVVSCLQGKIDQWYLASLHVPRAATAQQLAAELAGEVIQLFDDPKTAYQAAISDADSQDRIVVFGSFYTVAAALSLAV